MAPGPLIHLILMGSLIFPPQPLHLHIQWIVVKKQTATEGDANLPHALLVIYQPNQPPRWGDLSYNVIEELRHSALDNGISAPFTVNFGNSGELTI